MMVVYFLSVYIACAPGMYRSEFDPSCQLCPQNSESVSAASVECLCLDGYFRAPSEGAHSPCTGLQYILYNSILTTVLHLKIRHENNTIA